MPEANHDILQLTSNVPQYVLQIHMAQMPTAVILHILQRFVFEMILFQWKFSVKSIIKKNI